MLEGNYDFDQPYSGQLLTPHLGAQQSSIGQFTDEKPLTSDNLEYSNKTSLIGSGSNMSQSGMKFKK